MASLPRQYQNSNVLKTQSHPVSLSLSLTEQQQLILCKSSLHIKSTTILIHMLCSNCKILQFFQLFYIIITFCYTEDKHKTELNQIKSLNKIRIKKRYMQSIIFSSEAIIKVSVRTNKSRKLCVKQFYKEMHALKKVWQVR